MVFHCKSPAEVFILSYSYTISGQYDIIILIRFYLYMYDQKQQLYFLCQTHPEGKKKKSSDSFPVVRF